MGEAAPQAAVVTVFDENALAELRYGWGDAYLIDHDSVRGWWAVRRDQTGEFITAGDHEALRARIRADYGRRPVSREVAP
jgi:hypothetical protein